MKMGAGSPVLTPASVLTHPPVGLASLVCSSRGPCLLSGVLVFKPSVGLCEGGAWGGSLPEAWAGRSLARAGGPALPSTWDECQSQQCFALFRMNCSLRQVPDNLLIFLLNVPGWFSHNSVFISWSTAPLPISMRSHSAPPLLAGAGGNQALERSPLVE